MCSISHKPLLIYQETFQLDTSSKIEQGLQALPLKVNEELDVPLYRKNRVEISFPFCIKSQQCLPSFDLRHLTLMFVNTSP